MDIIIDKTKVFTEVRKTLEYIGFRTITDGGGNVYDILSASKEQEEMLDRFFDEGCTNIAHADKEYAKLTKLATGTSSYSTGSYNVSFIESVKEEYETFIEQDMVSYLVNYIIWQWLLLGNIAADRIQLYQAIAISFLRSYKGWFGSNVRGAAGESCGGNEIGDTVDSFVVDDDEGGSLDELVGCNEIGDDLPQEFGTRRYVRNRLCKQ